MSVPYVPFYPSDWLAGTRGMTAAETGVYITLIAMMYEREQPLDFDRKRLARLCGTTPATFKGILQNLIDDGKILETEDGLWNKRVEYECEKREEKIVNKREAANARWKKTQQKQQPTDADAVQEQCDRNANQNQNQNQNNSPNGESLPAPVNDISEAVVIFNEAAERVGWSKVQKMTPERTRNLKARLKEAGGIGGWRHAVDRAAESDFLVGKIKDFRASFDFLVSKSKFTKLMEGNYDNRSGQKGPAASRADAEADIYHAAGRMRRSSEPDWF